MSIRKLHHEEIIRTPPERIGEKPRNPLILIVDNVRSLYNVGSIFRTCDGVLAERILLSGYTPVPPRKEIDKTALGAAESVPWEYHRTAAAAVLRAKELGYTVAALEHTDQSVSCFDLTREAFPLAVVVGNEVAGIGQEALSLCDMAVEIPMHGIKQSLNVAVATGVILYECLRALEGKNASPS